MPFKFRITNSTIYSIIILQLTIFLVPVNIFALRSENVVVVANKGAPHSVELAKYYMRRRNIPMDNLIEIKAQAGEDCSRNEYERYVASPIRGFLKENDPKGDKFHCLVTMYGIPLRINPPELAIEEKKILLELQKGYDSIREKIKSWKHDIENEELKTLRKEEYRLKREIDQKRKVFQGASLDSELALVREDSFPLEGWLPNKYFLGFKGKEIKNFPQNVILVSRLDGPSEEVVRRIIDDSIEAERNGLYGKAYFDARWPYPISKSLTDYAIYDRAIHQAARIVEKSNLMQVVIDSKEEVFQVGQCPDAALYCGWYSLARYVDAFNWVRGAIGYHIASAECSTLRKKGSEVWCKMMLEKGVSATLGPVAEPYINAFPLPDLFFGLLIRSRLTLAECYALSNPYWSWQMVLIGDPLYRPFKNNVPFPFE